MVEAEKNDFSKEQIRELEKNLLAEGKYHKRRVRALTKRLLETPNLTAQQAEEIKRTWQEEADKTLTDYMADRYTYLVKTTNLLFDKPLSEKPEKHIGQKLTGQILDTVAAGVIDPTGESSAIEHVKSVGEAAWSKFSGFVKDKFSIEDTSQQTDTLVKETFLDVIKKWWVRYIARPEVIPNGPHNLGEDEKKIQPNTGDKYLQEEGYFTLGYEVDLPRQIDFNEFALRIAYLDLRQRVFERRLEANQGKLVSPLPLRPKSGYTIIIDADPDGKGDLLKVQIPLDWLRKSYTDFSLLMNQRIWNLLELKKMGALRI